MLTTAPNPPCSRPATPGRRAFTLVELLLTTAVIGSLFAGLIVVSNSLRADNAQHQTKRTLALLRRALLSYHAEHQGWPASPTTEALRDLRRHPPAGALLVAVGLHTDNRGILSVHDGYGRPVRYLEPAPPRMPLADFVSAGPDGRFGDLSSKLPEQRQAAMDDLFGHDVENFAP
jgi:prepilin-type N-terminal cleavage/methylation domain-containing protein